MPSFPSGSGSGWQQGLKTDDLLLQSSRLTSVSPRKTGSKPPGASTRGEPANKKQKISSKETLVESTDDSGDSEDPLDTFKWTKKSTKHNKTYGRSRTIGRTGSSLASSPNNPSTATTSRTTKKAKEIIEVDDSPPPKPPSRPRPRTKAKPASRTDSLPDKEAVTEEQGGGKKSRRKVEQFPLSISQTRTRSASPSSSSEKGKAKASDFPMDFSSSEQVPRAASFPQPSPEYVDEGDDTIMLTSPKRNSRPEVAPFPMTATQFGSPPIRRPGKSGHGRSDSQFSSYRSNDEEIISDSSPEKENMSPPGSISLSSSKRRSSEQEDESDIFAEKKKKRKKEATIAHTSSDSSLLPASARATLPSSPPPPSRLCPFCDEPLPQNISTRLKALIDSLVSRTHAAPRPGNPLGRDAPLALSINVCSAHRAEAQTIPQGLKKGWPRKIDFNDLPRRIKDRSTRKALEAIVNAAALDRKSKFWTAACNDIRKRGARVANSVQGQMETFHLTQPGYYGEQGFLVISEALQGIFPPAKLEAADIAPMNSQDFVRRVLVPETAILLIMKDTGQDYPTALKTMEDSREYGTALFPAKDNDGDVSFDLSFRVDSPPKPIATSAGKLQKQLKGKDSPKQKTAPQRVTRGPRSPIFSKLDSDEETEEEEEEEEEEEDRQEKGKAKKIVLVRNSSAPSSQFSSQRDRSPKPLPKPSGIRKVSERRTDTNSISSEREVQNILDDDPRASVSVTSTSKGSSSGSRPPKFLRPPARSPPPPPLRSLPVPIQVPRLGTSKPLPQRQNQPATKKPPPAKGKGKGKAQSNGEPELELIALGRNNPLPSLNPNSQKHRQAGGHHLEKGALGYTKNNLISASTGRIGLSRPQKVGSNGAKERSISAASHPTVSTPKKLPGDNVEILVDTPSDKMRRTYVRTPEHLFSKSSRKSPARFSRPQRRKPLSKAKTQRSHLPDDDEPEDIDSDSGGSDLPDIRWNAR